jgi:hypothetical protein
MVVALAPSTWANLVICGFLTGIFLLLAILIMLGLSDAKRRPARNRGGDNAWCADAARYSDGKGLMLLCGIIAFVVIGVAVGNYLASPWREVDSLESEAREAEAAGDHRGASSLRYQAEALRDSLERQEEEPRRVGKTAELKARRDELDAERRAIERELKELRKFD